MKVFADDKFNVAEEINFSAKLYVPSLPVAHLSDAPRGRLAVTGDSARIQDETTESSDWFFNVLRVYSTVTRNLH